MDIRRERRETSSSTRATPKSTSGQGRKTTLGLVLIRLLTITGSITEEVPINSGSRDFCYYETFEGFCADQQVILMIKALYGRMQFGRCVKTNFGFIGCFTSVIELLDRRCSGRQSCTVDVVEPTFDSIRPCNVELKSYLEAEYRCIRVPKRNAPGCDVTFSRDLDTVAITSGVTGVGADPTDQCGTDQRPWQLRVGTGQRLNVSLFQFTTFPAASENVDVIVADTTTPGVPHRDCHVVGQLTESQLKRRLSLCSSTNDARETHVYVSQTNLVDVTLSPTNDDRMILVFTAIGCPDLESGPNVWVRYSPDRSTAEVGCRHGTTSWQLFCRGREWIGHHDNCSVPVSSQSSTVPVHPGSIFKMNSVLVALIVVAVSATISVCVLITGLFIFKRLSVHGLSHRSSEQRRHLLNLFGRSRDPSLSDRPTLPPDDSDPLTQPRHRPFDCPLYRQSSLVGARPGSLLWPVPVSPGVDRCSLPVEPIDANGRCLTDQDLFVLKDNTVNEGVDLFKGGLFFGPVSAGAAATTACPECLAVGHPVRWDVDGLTECQERV